MTRMGMPPPEREPQQPGPELPDMRCIRIGEDDGIPPPVRHPVGFFKAIIGAKLEEFLGIDTSWKPHPQKPDEPPKTIRY